MPDLLGSKQETVYLQKRRNTLRESTANQKSIRSTVNKLISRIFLILLFKGVVDCAEIRLRSVDSLKSDITVQQGDLIDLEIFVDVGDIPSAGVEVYLTYEPDKLRLVNQETPFVQGPFYTGTVVLNKIVSTTRNWVCSHFECCSLSKRTWRRCKSSVCWSSGKHVFYSTET